MLSTTRSQSAFLLAIIVALIFVSVSLSAADFKAFGYTTPAFVDIESAEYRVNEPAGTVTVTLIRSGDYRQTTTVDYQTSEREASEGQDYKGAGGTITFNPGEGYKTVVLDVISDDEIEQAESFLLEVTSGGPNCIVARPSTVIWIEDTAPEAEPRLEIARRPDNSLLLSWEATRACTLERTLDPASLNWERVSCTPSVDGDRFHVVQAADGPVYFFRLRTE